MTAVEDIISQAGYFQELIELLNNADIIFPNECGVEPPEFAQRYRGKFKIPDFQTTVQILAKYLWRVCGSVPLGFRIIVKGKDAGDAHISYYYNANPLNCGL